MDSEARPLVIDIPTLAAISVVAWTLVNVLHEIVGHAGAAALLGIPVRAVSTTTMYLEWDPMRSAGAYRAILAGGTLVNLVSGAIALLVLGLRRPAHPAAGYFLWLFASFSFIIVAMNLVSVTLMGAGDSAEFTRQLAHREVWRAVIIAAGVVIAVLGYSIPLRLWLPDLRDNRGAQLLVTAIPVATMVAVQSLSLIGSPFARQPPATNHLLASVFVYFHFILWVILVNVVPVPRSRNPVESIALPRSYVTLVAGLAVALFYVAILGPGLGPLEDDPRLT